MHRQTTLPFRDEPDLDALWERLPEGSRRQLIRLWAQLMARVARPTARPKERKETSDDGPQR
jgi:hypothetical protein